MIVLENRLDMKLFRMGVEKILIDMFHIYRNDILSGKYTFEAGI